MFEFLMLFLAVTAGFLAENIREHSVAQKRAKVFVASMLEDLKADSAPFNFVPNDATFQQMKSSGVLTD